MKLFWTLWIVDALAALIVLYFFFVGLSDGTVTSRNARLWAVFILVLAGVLGGSYYFFSHGQLRVAYIVLSLLAIPALLMLMYLLFVVFGKLRWN
jgi:hypothetical protein